MAGRQQAPASGEPPSIKRVEAMVEDLLNTLRASPGPSTATTPAVAPTVAPTSSANPARVQQALKRESKKGKGRFSSRPMVARNIDLNIYVLPAPTSLTPKPSADLELAQAALGEEYSLSQRTAIIQRQPSKAVKSNLARLTKVLQPPRSHENTGTVAQIVNAIEKAFSKLKPLQGRWMFFKSTGGNGQRKLTLVPMDMEGYNGRQLRAASNNGRNVLFIVPLQQELDTEPLPFDAAEFSKMPQVPCHICGTTIPLQLLALHADSCEPPTKKMTDVVILEDSDPSHALEEKGVCFCPICQKEFLISMLAIHANICAESTFCGSETVQPDMETYVKRAVDVTYTV
uniref:Uncharacterized protein n=1 Tax=Knipowitschia caucasica TaxID=637954 RepID=A0AAV2JU18_KNICA